MVPSMRNVSVDFPTHSLTIYEDENGFIKVSNIVKGQLYCDMVDAILKDNACNTIFYFVGEERKVLSNFVKSLVGFNNSEENFYHLL